jgi:hypothetical protein
MVRRAQNGTRIPDSGRLTVADWSLYATRGFSLFPLGTNSKRPAIDTWEEYQTQRADAALVEAWSRSTLNTGVATGAVSNCFVLDLDGDEAWTEALLRGLPDTLTVKTPRGRHYYFRHLGYHIANRAGPRWTGGILGWDIRGDGGYVVGPGSTYVPTPAEAAKGKLAGAYVIESNAPIAPAPAWLVEMLGRRHEPDGPPVPSRVAETTSPYGAAAMRAELADLQAARPGHINDSVNYSTFRIAQLVGGGEIREDEARDSILEALAAMGGIDTEEKTLGTMERAWASGIDRPRAAPPAPTPEAMFGTREVIDPVVEAASAGEQPLAPPPPPVPFGPGVAARTVAGELFRQYFDGVVYVATTNAMFCPGGVSLGQSAFDGIYAGADFYIGETGDKPVKSPWEAFRNCQSVSLPRVYNTCFRPELGAGAIIYLDGLPCLNTYVPARVARTAGDPAPFVDHIRRMLPAGRDADLLLHWMASCVQNPGVKFQWWPFIQGVKGNGKTLVLSCMFEAVGARYSHLVSPTAMAKTGNQFNGWIRDKLLLGFEEIYTADSRRDTVELLKATVTNKRIAAESKGRDQETVDNRANGICLSNHADGMPIDEDERRFGMFFCAQQQVEHLARDGMNGDYFPRLYRWLDEGGYAIVSHYLATMPLEAALDPAGDMHRAPETSSTAYAIAESRGPLEQEILEAIEEGRPGFTNGIVRSYELKALAQAVRRPLAARRYRAVMQSLGYDIHPAMPEGRPNNAFKDGTRPRLYFRRGHDMLRLATAAEVIAAYEEAVVASVSANVVPFKRP